MEGASLGGLTGYYAVPPILYSVPQCRHLMERVDCADCRPRPAVPRPEPQPGPWFSAAYEGNCSQCGDEFSSGDLIRADGEGGWQARCCGRDYARPANVPDQDRTLLERFAAGHIDTGKGCQ